MTEHDWHRFLLEHETDRLGHTGRTLQKHLWGTYRLLREWGCEEAACRAGLFHSIYGTNAFDHMTVEPTSRDVIRQLIGAPAESLVYVFHCSERPMAWFEALLDAGTTSRISRQFVALSEWEVARLVEIECANLIEQKRGKALLGRLFCALELADVPVTDSVRLVMSNARQWPAEVITA